MSSASATPTTLSALEYFGQARHDRIEHNLRVAELEAVVPPGEIPEHEHRDAHLVFVLSGAYVSTARGMPEIASPLCAVANPPGTAHRDRFLTVPARYLVIGVERELWDSAPQRSDAPGHAHRLDRDAIGLLLRLHRRLRFDAEDGSAVEEAALELCALATGAVAAGRAAPAWLEQIRERFRVECLSPPSLIEAAREAGVHPTSLSRAFRRHYGLTISDWIRVGRIECAAELLRVGGASLAEAAVATGFSDQAHLTRAMRRTMNVTPGALRRLAAMAER